MGDRAAQYLAVNHVGQFDISGIVRTSRHLVPGINPGQAATDNGMPVEIVVVVRAEIRICRLFIHILNRPFDGCIAGAPAHVSAQ